MFKPQYNEYIQMPKERLQWIYNNIYMLHYNYVYSSKELERIIKYIESIGIVLKSLDNRKIDYEP